MGKVLIWFVIIISTVVLYCLMKVNRSIVGAWDLSWFHTLNHEFQGIQEGVWHTVKDRGYL